MKLLVINPNTSEAMTRSIRGSLSSLAAQDLQIDVKGNVLGPESIECVTDELISGIGCLTLLQQHREQYDAFVIACFSDHPAVTAGRELLCKPVLGIMEAAMLTACMLGHKFSIVTSSRRWEPLLLQGVSNYGLSARCAGVRSSGLAVLDFNELSDDEIVKVLARQGRAAIEEDGAEVLCLGCAGMAGLDAELSRQLGVPVLDGVRCAIEMARLLVDMRLFTSKANTFAPVEPRHTSQLSATLREIYRDAACDD